jgi:predicted SprT family Zn-dependent metalloprotease
MATVTTLAWTRRRADELIGHHLHGWRFEFDHARARVGCCHYADRRITLSRHLVLHLTAQEVDQALFHEIAHAQAGQRAGHGEAWRKKAKALGYTGRRTMAVPDARAQARWRAACPRGHEYQRHRRPSGRAYCSICAKTGVWYPLTWVDGAR